LGRRPAVFRTVNYVYPQTLSIFGTTLRTALNLTEQDYACASGEADTSS
jgi:hypothetical protein